MRQDPGHGRQKETAFKKLAVVPGLALSTVLSLLLLVANLRGTNFSGPVVNFVINNRDSVALIVQVISVLLGVLDVWALRTSSVPSTVESF